MLFHENLRRSIWRRLLSCQYEVQLHAHIITIQDFMGVFSWVELFWMRSLPSFPQLSEVMCSFITGSSSTYEMLIMPTKVAV